MPKSAEGIMQQLSKSLDENGEELVQKLKASFNTHGPHPLTAVLELLDTQKQHACSEVEPVLVQSAPVCISHARP